MEVSPYLHILRPINCFIVGLTQYLMYYFLFIPVLKDSNLTFGTLSLLVLATIMVTGSGYVINDIIDTDIDRINKKEKRFVGSRISINDAWMYYYTLILIGFGLSLLVAYLAEELGLIWIYPCMVIMLYGYSRYWKATALLGNLIVSLFTAFVPGILMLADRKAIYRGFLNDDENVFILLICLAAYILFAFLSNFSREIIKDIEDLEGDRSMGLQTLPIVLGVRKSKMIALVYVCCILLLLFFFNLLFFQFSYLKPLLINSLALIPANLFIIFRLFKARERSDFTFVSNQLKLFMVLGIVSILSISNFLFI